MIIDKYLENLQEDTRKQKSRISVTRQTKVQRAQSILSTNMAREKNDPQYKLLKKYCDLCQKYRDAIHKKYGARNRSKEKK